MKLPHSLNLFLNIVEIFKKTNEGCLILTDKDHPINIDNVEAVSCISLADVETIDVKDTEVVELGEFCFDEINYD